MEPKPFQKATIRHALARLRDARGPRRFLVADEVGLGKTMVARGVIDAMRREKPGFEVLYICSSQSIARQNRDRLLEILETQEEREAAQVPVDRITLLPLRPRARRAGLTLYTLTPRTMAGARGHRTGNVRERAVIAELLRHALPDLSQRIVRHRLQQHVGKNAWQWHLWQVQKELAERPLSRLLKSFRRHIAKQLKLSPRAHQPTIVARLRDDLRHDTRDTIAKLRMALGEAALGTIRPDLIILDEFQRFFEDIQAATATAEDGDTRAGDEPAPDEDDDPRARSLMQSILRDDTGKPEEAPAILLLSATPYRLYSTWSEGREHYRQLFDLLRFLHGDRAREHEEALKSDFRAYEAALRQVTPASSREPGALIEIRDRIQKRMRRVMARTERSQLLAAPSHRDHRIPCALEPDDIRVFRHLSASARPAHAAMVTPLWSSVPYPMQMLDTSYQLYKGAQRDLPLRDAVLERSRIRAYHPVPVPHPRLRGLLKEHPADRMALPWLPPLLPYWPLDGLYRGMDQANQPSSKTLVFSRYRAVPRAVAALLSYEVERHCFRPDEHPEGKRYHYFARNRSAEEGYEDVESTGRLARQPAASFPFAKGKEGIALVPMFFPAPALARLGNPLDIPDRASLSYRRAIEHVARRLGETCFASATRRSSEHALWQWIATVERNARTRTDLRAGWSAWLDDKNASEPPGAKRAAEAFLGFEGVPAPLRPSDRQLERLAELALLSPANVLYRAVARVFGKAPSAEARATRIAHVTRASVGSLRGYLDMPELHVLFARHTGQDGQDGQHPSAVRRVLWDGNFEAVLDEYLVLLRGLGDREAAPDAEHKALQDLETALGIRTASVTVHRTGRDDGEPFHLRCHAAMPFGLTDKDEVAAKRSGKLRSEHLRQAFNSPFRPFVLVSTSIGQEGLDFHRYCEHIVHWDLPSNPVDLEQRDGRIQRHGSLAVRRAMVARLAHLPLDDGNAHTSPWRRIGEAQHERDGGLSPWWGDDDTPIRRTVYVPSWSRIEAELERLQADRALYRLALGQSDQEHLVRALQRRLTNESHRADLEALLKRAAIDLCPYRSK